MGVLDRLILSDAQCSRISQHIIGDERTRGSSGHNNRIEPPRIFRRLQLLRDWSHGETEEEIAEICA